MTALAMMITNAGLDAIVAAESGGTDEIRITQIGLTATPFVAAPTLEALPGEFKRIDAVSGQAVSANVIHVTAYDPSADVYDVTGIGIYTSDGVLLAVYSAAADAVLSKAQLATGLIMFDIAFANNMAALIEFGDALFLNPPASETVKGVAEIATNAEADAGVDDTRIMSPRKVKRVIDALAGIVDAGFTTISATFNAAISALEGRTIEGAGLVTGGGNLTANRVLTVLAATDAQVRAGTNNASAITPAALGPMLKSLTINGYATIPAADPSNTPMICWGRFTAPANGVTSVSFPMSFSEAAFSVVVDGTSDNSNDAQDNYPSVRPATITASGFQVHNANQTSDLCCFIAIGRINLA